MDARMRGEAGMALAALVDELLADGTLDDADLERIGGAAARERERLLDDRRVVETAHVCDQVHASVITLVPYDEGGRTGEREDVDASGVVCHDCGRALVSDAGSLPILVCPRVHGRRGQLRPAGPFGAVECGRT